MPSPSPGKPPHLLILGGARLLGPVTIAAALERGWRITVANRGSVPRGGYPPGVEHTIADRGDAGQMRALAERDADAVLDFSCYAPEHARISLAAFAETESRPAPRYILMSTGAVYAESFLGPLAEETPATGRALWGEYGATKVAIERVAARAERPPVLVRPAYILGRHDFMERLPFIFDRLAADLPVLIPDSGKACLQFVAAEDVAGACLSLAEADGLPDGAAFNVGPPEWTTLTGLVELCAQALDRPAAHALVDLADVGLGDAPYSWTEAFFPFADQHYVLDARKLDEVIGPTAYEPLTDLIARLAADYRESASHRTLELRPSERRAYARLGIPAPPAPEGRTLHVG